MVSLVVHNAQRSLYPEVCTWRNDCAQKNTRDCPHTLGRQRQPTPSLHDWKAPPSNHNLVGMCKNPYAAHTHLSTHNTNIANNTTNPNHHH